MAPTDEIIKKEIVDQLTWDDRIDASKVTVEVHDGNVSLSGEVPTFLAKMSAAKDASNILGVHDVENHIIVKYAASVTLPTDDEMKTNIEEKLAVDPDLDLLNLDVSVDEGVVTLKGTVDAAWKSMHAETLAESETGIVTLENHIAVVPSGSILDRVIAADIVESLERKQMTSADDIDVQVEGGKVTLKGTVPNYAARQSAYESALFTSGVAEIDDCLKVTSTAQS